MSLCSLLASFFELAGTENSGIKIDVVVGFVDFCGIQTI